MDVYRNISKNVAVEVNNVSSYVGQEARCVPHSREILVLARHQKSVDLGVGNNLDAKLFVVLETTTTHKIYWSHTVKWN